MSFDFESFTDSYIGDLQRTLSQVSRTDIEALWAEVEAVGTRGGSIHMIGNGGSAATPSHSAGDWSKELKIRTIAHTDNISSFTAWANDTDYANVFAGQLSTFAMNGDLVIAYSGSGNSPNVLNGIKAAILAGCRTAAITGNYNGGAGGKLVGLVDVAIIVPTESMERIEDMQLIINHIVKEASKAKRERGL
ncbi:MAG TPA: SIS domain-containing protein [Candidatus Thalassarchaeaceae archaeon]|nr:SIS domain-containing protein [Candidatus Thalassarchaeaceae archaeon]